MAVSAFPAIVDALVTLAPGSVPSGVTVAEGIPATDDPADFLAIGVQSLTDTGSLFAGESRQGWAGIGAVSRDEEGTVVCIVAARSTDDTVKNARDRAFAIVEGVASLLRSNITLGLSTVVHSSIRRYGAGPLYEDRKPPAYVVEFEIYYQARI